MTTYPVYFKETPIATTMMQRTTFIENAFRDFDEIQNLCVDYHISKQAEALGLSRQAASVGWEQVVTPDAILLRYYVEGTMVLVRRTDRKTHNITLHTTNGDQWYGNNFPERLLEDAKRSPQRAPAPVCA